MRTNVRRTTTPLTTHEGGKAQRINAEMQLRRATLACMLWEDTFYESGLTIAERIKKLVPNVLSPVVARIAEQARTEMKLRHVPLLLARELARTPHSADMGTGTVSRLLPNIILRPDELTEFLSLYWKHKRQPLSAQVKKGLARAFTRFDPYQLGKYDRNTTIKLRDVLFLTHAKPKTEAQEKAWKDLCKKELKTVSKFDNGKGKHATWEQGISAAKKEARSKKEVWEEMLNTPGKMGALALIKNLRNMAQDGVDRQLINNALAEMRTDKVLPFRFITAARYVPQFEPGLEAAMYKCIYDKEKLYGKTVLVIDVSGSMDSTISSKSDTTCMDAACGIAVLAREICTNVQIYAFSNQAAYIPPRRGFALRDAIVRSMPHGGTYLASALMKIQKEQPDADRTIVFTDEQTHDGIANPVGQGYVVNVQPYRNGVGYGRWNHIDGFSEAILDYIGELENLYNEEPGKTGSA